MAFISFIITLVFSRCPIYWTLCTCDMFLLFLMTRLVLTFALFCGSFYGRKSSQTTTTKSTSNISAIPNDDICEDEFSSSSDEEEEINVDGFELESETDEEIILSQTETEDGLSGGDQEHPQPVAPASPVPVAQPILPPPRIEWSQDNDDDEWVAPNDSKVIEKNLSLKPGINLTNRSMPIEFFNLFVSTDFYELIHEQTSLLQNIYKTSQSMVNSAAKKVDNVAIEDIKKLFGIILYMGIVKLPNRRMYWQSQTRIDLIAEAMPVNRFAQILHVLHYNNNNLIPNANNQDYNKCYKVQPLVDRLREKFASVVIPETFVSVDEQVVPFKGASGLKRYLPKKKKSEDISFGHLLACRGMCTTLK